MNTKVTVTGDCTQVGAVETVGQNGFKKRTFVLEEDAGGNSKWPKRLAFVLKKDDVEKVNYSHQGRKLTVTGYIESREYNGRWYTDITAKEVGLADVAPATPAPAAPAQQDEFIDDVPF